MAATDSFTPPLSKGQYQTIQKGLAAAAAAATLCDRYESLGMDCTTEREQLEGIRQTLMAFKAEFFPDQP